MTPRTAAMARSVVAPEMIISQRALATRRAAAGSNSGAASAKDVLMNERMQGSEQVVGADEEAGQRLDRVLAARIARLSRSRLKALILDGQVTIGGRTIRDPGHRVNRSDSIAVTVPEPEPAQPQPQNIPLDI